MIYQPVVYSPVSSRHGRLIETINLLKEAHMRIQDVFITHWLDKVYAGHVPAKNIPIRLWVIYQPVVCLAVSSSYGRLVETINLL